MLFKHNAHYHWLYNLTVGSTLLYKVYIFRLWYTKFPKMLFPYVQMWQSYTLRYMHENEKIK